VTDFSNFGRINVDVYYFRTLSKTLNVTGYSIVKTGAESDQVPALEVHGLDPTELTTGDSIEVEWLQFIRPEQKFAGLEQLKTQIAKDCLTAKELAL
jgi:FAD synthase